MKNQQSFVSDLSIHVDLFVIPLATSWQTLTHLGLLSDWSPLPLGGTVGSTEGAEGRLGLGIQAFSPTGSSVPLLGKALAHTLSACLWACYAPSSLKQVTNLESRYALGQDETPNSLPYHPGEYCECSELLDHQNQSWVAQYDNLVNF